MQIDILSGKLQFDDGESNDTEFNVSKLIVQMELSEMSKSGLLPENFNCSFIFSWTDLHPDNNRPFITKVDRKCSEKILSKKLESAVNVRLLKIAKSDDNTFKQNSDIYLATQVRNTQEAKAIVSARKVEILETEQARKLYNGIIVENALSVKKLNVLLMVITNNQIPRETARRVLDILSREEA